MVVAEAAAVVVVSFLVVFKGKKAAAGRMAINIGMVLPATEVLPVDLITLSAEILDQATRMTAAHPTATGNLGGARISNTKSKASITLNLPTII